MRIFMMIVALIIGSYAVDFFDIGIETGIIRIQQAYDKRF